MQRKRLVLLLVITANALILVGTISFNWSSATVAAIFLVDAGLAIIRTPIERLFAKLPPHKEELHVYDFVSREWNLIEKRGYYRLPLVPINIYPHNTAHVLRYMAALCGVLGLLFVFYYFGELSGSPPDDWSVGPAVAVIFPVLLAKHAGIINLWARNGIYERASVETVRPWGGLQATLVGIFTAGSILILPPEILTTIVAIILVPKFLFDLREAGIGPSLLTFDPTCDRESEGFPLPPGRPQSVFSIDRRAVRAGAIFLITPQYLLVYGIVVFGVIAGGTYMVAGFGNSTWDWITVIGATVGIVAGISLIVAEISYADLEYQLYGDTLVAYDNRLEEVQWRVPLEEIRTVSAKHSFFSLLTPFCGPSVRLEYRGGDPPVENIFNHRNLKKISFLRNATKMADLIDRRIKQTESLNNETVTE